MIRIRRKDLRRKILQNLFHNIYKRVPQPKTLAMIRKMHFLPVLFYDDLFQLLLLEVSSILSTVMTINYSVKGYVMGILQLNSQNIPLITNFALSSESMYTVLQLNCQSVSHGIRRLWVLAIPFQTPISKFFL